MNVTKYPAEWVNAVAPSTPASPARSHDNLASLSKISLATRDMLSDTAGGAHRETS